MFRRDALTAIEAQTQNPRPAVGSGQWAVGGRQFAVGGRPTGGSMKRALVGLALMVAAASNSGVARAQGDGPSTAGANPGFLARNFSPATYLKASNPRADA